jgi:hypothetical protein
MMAMSAVDAFTGRMPACRAAVLEGDFYEIRDLHFNIPPLISDLPYISGRLVSTLRRHAT